MHLFVLIYYGKIEDHDCVDLGGRRIIKKKKGHGGYDTLIHPPVLSVLSKHCWKYRVDFFIVEHVNTFLNNECSTIKDSHCIRVYLQVLTYQ